MALIERACPKKRFGELACCIHCAPKAQGPSSDSESAPGKGSVAVIQGRVVQANGSDEDPSNEWGSVPVMTTPSP